MLLFVIKMLMEKYLIEALHCIYVQNEFMSLSNKFLLISLSTQCKVKFINGNIFENSIKNLFIDLKKLSHI